jgi:dephospho-CoA kinase
MRKVLGFCGLPGSGKSTAIESIQKFGNVVIMGDIVREEVKKRNLPLTDENLGTIAKEWRQKYGKGIIAKKCVELIENKTADIIFIDGLRSMAEVRIFRKKWKFPVIAIIISQEKRFNIIKSRARKDDPQSIEELTSRDRREIQFGLKEVIENADFTIMNDSTKKSLKKKTKKLVVKVLNNYSK